MKIGEFIREASRELWAAGLAENQAEARRELRFILREELGLSFARQYEASECKLSPKEVSRLKASVARRLEHEPLSSIYQRQEFYGRSFSLNEATLAPRPETEILLELALEISPPIAQLRVAELCCGSGALGISYCRELSDRAYEPELLLSDISEKALESASKNCEHYLKPGSFHLVPADLYPAEPALQSFDIILINPPYIASADCLTLMPEVRKFEPRLALDGGEDGLDFYRRIIEEICPRLKPGAWLILEHGKGQRKAVEGLLSAQPELAKGLSARRAVNDYAGLDRVLAWRF